MKILTNDNKFALWNNKALQFVVSEPVDHYNPLCLPANTIRVKFSSGYIPEMGDTQTLVDSTNNVWDIYKQSNDWGDLFNNNNTLLEVLGANTTNVTRMVRLFDSCNILTNVSLFDTSNITSMNNTFFNCYNVQTGALALYQQASTQTTPPSTHISTFSGCGQTTTTGRAELAQIPNDWK